jgi:hypothetical protein
MGGVLTDPTGAVMPNARITVTEPDNGFSMSTGTDQAGRWIVFNVPSGRAQIRAEAPGFKTLVQDAVYDAGRPAPFSLSLSIGSSSETVAVMAEAPALNGANYTELQLLPKNPPQQTASANVLNLQRRVAGVLPVAIDVPRTGTSFSFVRPLVLDEETKVTFSYKSK